MTLLIDERGVPALKKNIVSKIDELFIFGEDFVTLTNRCVSTEQRLYRFVGLCFFLVKGMAMIVTAKLIVMCMGDISFNGGIWGCCSGMYV